MADIDTLGLLEFSSVARGYEAADAALKTAPVDLVLARSVCPGKYLVALAGNVRVMTPPCPRISSVAPLPVSRAEEKPSCAC